MDRSFHFSGLWQDDERAAVLDAIGSLAAPPREALRGPEWTCHRWALGERAVYAASHADATRMLTAATADELALRLRGYGTPADEPVLAAAPLARAA